MRVRLDRPSSLPKGVPSALLPCHSPLVYSYLSRESFSVSFSSTTHPLKLVFLRVGPRLSTLLTLHSLPGQYDLLLWLQLPYKCWWLLNLYLQPRPDTWVSPAYQPPTLRYFKGTLTSVKWNHCPPPSKPFTSFSCFPFLKERHTIKLPTWAGTWQSS